MKKSLVTALLGSLVLTGCIGTVVKTVVTAPIKAAGAVVDAATTSQAEADRNRGRAARKEEQRAEKDRKKAEKEARKQRDD
jgi:outer membrane murein-binding lipoprotein Lpp